MLLTELILSKRGPLAKVWLSAHHERKLSKQQALGVDLGESVDAILGQEDGGVTLRVSGQLMLGVTRIYSRKAQYLLDDCKETREKISRAFRPGNVDLPEDQHRASKNAITFNDTENIIDIFDWSWAVLPPLPLPTTGTSSTQLNLRPSGRGEYGAYNFGRPHAPSLYGGSTPSRQSVEGDPSTDHLESNEFSEIDLGIDPLGGDFDFTGGETGRDAASARGRSRTGSRFGSMRPSLKGMSVEPNQDIPFNEEGIDLNIFDEDLPALPALDPTDPLDPMEERRRRETSALSTPPPISPSDMTDITPRTAHRVANLADARDRSSPAAPRVKRNKVVQADDDLELADEELAPGRDISDILTVERYIPVDSDIIRLREIAADPGAYFIPTIRVGGESMFYAGPQGLAPELEELFTFPSNILRRRAASPERQEEEGPRANKRARTEQLEEQEGQQAEDQPGDEAEGLEGEEAEAARRNSVVPSARFGVDMGLGAGDDSFNLGQDASNDFDLGFDNPDVPETPRKAPGGGGPRAPSLAPSQVDMAIQQGQRAGGGYTLAIFDSRAYGNSESQSQSQATPTKSVVSEQVSRTTGGFSRETGLAMGLLRKELEAIESGEEEKVVKFDTLAQNATKKAAASFFFELLVLGTKDYVKLDQQKAYQDISIEAKPKLWDVAA